jgi:hypothetical protein
MKAVIISAILFVLVATQVNAWFYQPWGYYGYNPWSYYGYGYRYFRETLNTDGQVDQRVQCTYSGSNSMLTCNSVNTSVVCNVVANLTWFQQQQPVQKYEVFGIGRYQQPQQSSNTSCYWYGLYPRTLNNSQWLNTTWSPVVGETVVPSGQYYHVSIFYTPSYQVQKHQHYGFRVVDEECYQRLVYQFNNVTQFEYVHVRDVTNKVPFVGELRYI